jgi:hypothetical protein
LPPKPTDSIALAVPITVLAAVAAPPNNDPSPDTIPLMKALPSSIAVRI